MKGNLRLENVRASGERQARAEHWGGTGDSAEVPERGGPEEVTVRGEGNGITTGSEANGLDLGTDYQGSHADGHSGPCWGGCQTNETLH